MSLVNQISAQIATVTGGDFVCESHQGMGGGCINTAMRIDGNGTSYFVKLNSASLLDMFVAEAEGLKAMADTKTIRVPVPVCHGVAGDSAFLAMEYLSPGKGSNMALLGERLAEMHRHANSQYGFHIDNTIGSTPQDNTFHDDWIAFWQERRLGAQLTLAGRNGCGSSLYDSGQKLIETLPVFFKDYQPPASMLHGDLWGGNFSHTGNAEPVIFDPASYYGDREADIAMTELFGGFGTDFYSAYNNTWPMDAGYKVRKTLYNLYHIINHFNLFGGGYLGQAESMTGRLLSEAG